MAKKPEVPQAVHEEGKTLDGLSYLSADSIGDLDHGFARICIAEELKKVANDLEQRGDDDKARKLVITLSFTRVNENDTKIEFDCQAKLPTLKLAPTIAQRRGTGQGQHALAFRPENPTRPDQPSIFHPEQESE